MTAFTSTRRWYCKSTGTVFNGTWHCSHAFWTRIHIPAYQPYSVNYETLNTVFSRHGRTPGVCHSLNFITQNSPHTNTAACTNCFSGNSLISFSLNIHIPNYTDVVQLPFVNSSITFIQVGTSSILMKLYCFQDLNSNHANNNVLETCQVCFIP